MSNFDNQVFQGSYLLVPRINYEHWQYLPVCFTNKINAGSYWYISHEADLFQFGVLNSAMYMAWIKCASGRINCYDRIHHSPSIKHFPWPITHTQAQIAEIEEKSMEILRARSQYPGTPLAELYHPLTMPTALLEAHRALDQAVDDAYEAHRFTSDDSRVGFLLSLQRKLSTILVNLYDDEPAKAEMPTYYDGTFTHSIPSANRNSVF